MQKTLNPWKLAVDCLQIVKRRQTWSYRRGKFQEHLQLDGQFESVKRLNQGRIHSSHWTSTLWFHHSHRQLVVMTYTMLKGQWAKVFKSKTLANMSLSVQVLESLSSWTWFLICSSATALSIIRGKFLRFSIKWRRDSSSISTFPSRIEINLLAWISAKP